VLGKGGGAVDGIAWLGGGEVCVEKMALGRIRAYALQLHQGRESQCECKDMRQSWKVVGVCCQEFLSSWRIL
jgi:hypothetical protein